MFDSEATKSLCHCATATVRNCRSQDRRDGVLQTQCSRDHAAEVSKLLEQIAPNYLTRLTPGWAANPYFSKPTNTAAESRDFRRETTAFAGKVSSGQPNAMQIIIT